MHLPRVSPLGATVLTLASLVSATPQISAEPTRHIPLIVNPSTTYQTIEGFGFCQAFQRANALINLPEPHRSDVLDLLFNTTAGGAGFSILRIGLGSSPDSRGDHMNSPQPTANSEFKWDGVDSGQVWVAQQALRYGVKTFIADAWSAPGYMKTNGRDDQGGWLCGVQGEGQGGLCAGVSWIKPYAEYLAKYVKAWVGAGIPIHSVGFLNEPNLIKNYATMQSDGYQAAEVAPVLVDALKDIGLPEVGVSCCEGQGWSYARDLLAEMQEAGAVEGTLKMITTHTYKGTPPGPDEPLNTTLPVWVTEISPIMDKLGFTQTWYNKHAENEGLLTAINIHTAIVTGNVSAYIYWIGVEANNFEPPMIWAPSRRRNATAPDTAVPYTIGSTYWAPAQFSRFIRPGAVRIDVKQGGVSRVEALLTSAYRNVDGSVVIQAINNGDDDLSVSVAGLSTGCKMGQWVTDGEEKLTRVETASADDGKVNLTKRSLTTLAFVC